MKLTWHTELVQWLLMAAMFAAAAVCWHAAPDRIPIHWNIQGQVDGYGGKFTGLLMIPLMTLALYVMMVVLPRIDPGYVNYASFAGAYHAIRISLTVFLAGLYAVVLLAAFDKPVDVGLIVPLGVGALLIVAGAVMQRLRPNWFVGVRTPWTLSSRLSWDKTHRLAGWLFLLLGPLVALTGVLQSGLYLAATLIFAALGIGGLVVYSYLVYRRDPDRVVPAATSPRNH